MSEVRTDGHGWYAKRALFSKYSYFIHFFLCVHGAHAVAAERPITHKPSTRWLTAAVGLRWDSGKSRKSPSKKFLRGGGSGGRERSVHTRATGLRVGIESKHTMKEEERQVSYAGALSKPRTCKTPACRREA